MEIKEEKLRICDSNVSICAHMILSTECFLPASLWDSSHNYAARKKVIACEYLSLCTTDHSKYQHSREKGFASGQKGRFWQSAGIKA